MRATRLVGLSFAAALPAQQFLVDVNGGPGTSFTSLAAAAAAVPNGATLLVMPGNYSGVVTISGKGLTILANPGVSIVAGGITVQNSLPGQTNILRGLSITDFPAQLFSGAVFISGCQGRVVIESLVSTPASGLPSSATPNPVGLSVVASPQVALRNCTIGGSGLSVSSSQLVAEDCSFTGRAPFWPGAFGAHWGATEAIAVGPAATVQLTGCSAVGGSGVCSPFVGCTPSKPAVSMLGGTLVLRGPGSCTGGVNGSVQNAAIEGTGAARIDPSVLLTGPATLSPPPQIVSMPSARSTSAGLGGALSATANGGPGNLLLLVLGLPGPAVSVPGIVDAFWMDPASHLYAAIGVTQPLTASLAVPVSQPLRGFEVSWQAVSLDPVAGLLASQPSIAFVF